MTKQHRHSDRPVPTRRVQIVNLLSTDLTLVRGTPGNETSKTYYNPGPAAKVVSRTVLAANVYPNGDGLNLPLLNVLEREVVGLPDEDERSGKLYVVSGAVAGFLKGRRKDVCTPSRMIVDRDGWVVGCRALMQIVGND